MIRFILCRWDRRRSRISLLIFITGFNFLFGLFLISSFISTNEKDTKLITLNQIRNNIEITDSTTTTRKFNERIVYSYYFRIDYTIIQSICKPIYLFNTTKNRISIQNLTNLRIQSLFNRNITIHLDIITINPILIKIDKIKEKKNVCDYLIELYIGLNLFCEKSCQLKELKYLTSSTEPFGHLLKNDFSFLFYSNNKYELPIQFNINQIFLYQTSIYLNKLVYIRSYKEIRYVSSLIIDSDGYQSSITMSQIDRSLFLIKDGLDQITFERDSTTIFISFLSYSLNNLYLRHESGRIKLGKLKDFHLFKQDSTFKLLFSQKKKDLIAFESINLPTFYIAIDQETKTALVLERPLQIQTDIELLDQRFLFKFIFN